jgi:endonuclease-3
MKKTAGRPPVVSHKTPFQVLISTVLSQRTRDENTALASKKLFAVFPSAKTLSNAPLAKIEKLIKPAGFYRVKAKRIREISRLLAKDFKGKPPKDLEGLLSLPGVGRKTANCVLVYAFREPAMPVDVHVHRISNRLGLVKTKTPEQTEQALMKTVPREHWLELNHLMVRYGQKICLPRNPKCNECGLRPQCAFFKALKPRKKNKPLN